MQDIPSHEKRYAITHYGDVWSHPKPYSPKWCFLKPSIKFGYAILVLFKNLKYKNYRVHRLVALTYIPNPNNYPLVRHLDNNKLNNHVSNLEWCTHKTNTQQAHDDGLCKNTEKQRKSASIIGKSCGKRIAKFSIDNIQLQVFDSMLEAQRATWIWASNISKCIRWELRQTGWYVWKQIPQNN